MKRFLNFSMLAILILVVSCQQENPVLPLNQTAEVRTSCETTPPATPQCVPTDSTGCIRDTVYVTNASNIAGFGCKVNYEYKVLRCPSGSTVYDAKITSYVSGCNSYNNLMNNWFNTNHASYNYYMNYALRNMHYYAKYYEEQNYNPATNDENWTLQVSTASCVKSCALKVRTACSDCCCSSYTHYEWNGTNLVEIGTDHSTYNLCSKVYCSPTNKKFPCTTHCYEVLIDQTF